MGAFPLAISVTLFGLLVNLVTVMLLSGVHLAHTHGEHGHAEDRDLRLSVNIWHNALDSAFSVAIALTLVLNRYWPEAVWVRFIDPSVLTVIILFLFWQAWKLWKK